MQISRMLSLQSCPASVPGTPHHPDWPALEGGRIAKLNWCPGGLNVTPGFSVSIEVFIRCVDGVHFCHPWDTKFSVWHEACSLHPHSCQEPALVPTTIGMLLGMDLLLRFSVIISVYFNTVLFHWWCVHTVDAHAHVVRFSWPFGMSAALRSSSSSGCRPQCAGHQQVCTEPKRAGGTWSYVSLEDGWSCIPWINLQLMYVLAGKHNYAATSQSCTVGKQLKPGDVISICWLGLFGQSLCLELLSLLWDPKVCNWSDLKRPQTNLPQKTICQWMPESGNLRAIYMTDHSFRVLKFEMW